LSTTFPLTARDSGWALSGAPYQNLLPPWQALKASVLASLKSACFRLPVAIQREFETFSYSFSQGESHYGDD